MELLGQNIVPFFFNGQRILNYTISDKDETVRAKQAGERGIQNKELEKNLKTGKPDVLGPWFILFFSFPSHVQLRDF